MTCFGAEQSAHDGCTSTKAKRTGSTSGQRSTRRSIQSTKRGIVHLSGQLERRARVSVATITRRVGVRDNPADYRHG
jgi:hypothetical protein